MSIQQKVCSLCILTGLLVGALARADELSIDRSVLAEGDADWDWTQARTAYVSSNAAYSLTTMSRTAKEGSHGYHDIFVSFSQNHGEKWSKPVVIPSLRRLRHSNGYEVVAGDLWPTWHAATGKVLLTGKTFNFADGTKENFLLEKVFYAVMEPRTRACGPLQTVDMPPHDHEGRPFVAPNAGCHQPVVMSNSELLLPIRYQKNREQRNYTTIVARCRFDGSSLTYLEHGSEHSLPTKRGLYEPSVTKFREGYFLTMRADDGAYVAKSGDGINYSKHTAWKFDDGQLLGSYNTQQHWVVIGGKLYLVYTRRGANNDHIMRHRAPLFIAEVDPIELMVKRETEQVLVPENHATLGNFGVCRIDANETWVTVAEGRVSYGARKGQPNQVILIKIQAN